MSVEYKKHLQTQLTKISEEAKNVSAEMETKFKESGEVSSELKEKFDKLIAEGVAVRQDLEALNGLKGLDDYLSKPETKNERVPDRIFKSIGDLIRENNEYKNYSRASRIRFGIDTPFKTLRQAIEQKATFSASGTGLTALTQGQTPILIGTQPLTVRELFAQGTTNLSSYPFMQEVSNTNAATTVAEGGTKPEATFDLVEVLAPVRKIAVTSKVTDETFADYATLESYIEGRLAFMVGQTAETQLLSGDGTSPNLTGVLTASILTQAKGADSVIDAIYKGINKVRTTGFFEADAIVMHPNDFEPIRLAKDDSNNYLGGNPFSQMFGDTLWGKRVVLTTAMTENTALIGAFQLGGQVLSREGLRLEMTNSNEDDFKKNLIAIRAEERMAFALYRPSAFCKVTGI